MKILLVNMPFAAIRPAIGPSLLKGRLEQLGHTVTIQYLNAQFAEIIGYEEYSFIADKTPPQSLAGDWVFAETLSGPRPRSDADYRAAYLERFQTDWLSGGDQALDVLGRARAHATGFIDECLTTIRWNWFDIVGFTSTFTQNTASLALAAAVKRRFPKSIIVFGGANCEDEMGLALHNYFPQVDFVCSGEADVSFPQLVECLSEKIDPTGVPGIISRVGDESRYVSLSAIQVRNLDDLPIPDYSDYAQQVSSSFESGIPLESSRGCWWGEKHHCTFCGLNGMSMAFRRKSAGRVLDEIRTQRRRYPVKQINMVDNILDPRYFQDLIPGLAAEALDIEIFYETKANLSRTQIDALGSARVTAIQPGIESLSTNVLRLMRKGTTTLQNIQLLKWCKEAQIKVFWNLLYGFPGETETDYEDTVALVEAIAHLDPPQGHGPVRLDRFSPNYVTAESLGFHDVRPDRSYGYIYDRPVDDLSRLAYYFEHAPVEPGPGAYLPDISSSIERWLSSPIPRCTYIDFGDVVAIWDFRPIAEERLRVLEGATREVFLFCDAHRSRSAVLSEASRLGVPEPELEEILTNLLDARLLITADDRFLSVPTRATPPDSVRPSEVGTVFW